MLDEDSLEVLWRLVGRGQEGAARKLQKSRIWIQKFWNWARWGTACEASREQRDCGREEGVAPH